MTMEWHEINDPAGRPHEEIGADQRDLELIEPLPCQHANRRINLSTAFLQCDDCGEMLLDINGWVDPVLRVPR